MFQDIAKRRVTNRSDPHEGKTCGIGYSYTSKKPPRGPSTEGSTMTKVVLTS